MKTLQNIGRGLLYVLWVVYWLIASVFSFILIFDSQNFMAILCFVVFLVSLATSLTYAWEIGKHLSENEENKKLQHKISELQHENSNCKSKAIKCFQEMLKERTTINALSLDGEEFVYVEDIDAVYKELVGDTNA